MTGNHCAVEAERVQKSGLILNMVLWQAEHERRSSMTRPASTDIMRRRTRCRTLPLGAGSRAPDTQRKICAVEAQLEAEQVVGAAWPRSRELPHQQVQLGVVSCWGRVDIQILHLSCTALPMSNTHYSLNIHLVR